MILLTLKLVLAHLLGDFVFQPKKWVKNKEKKKYKSPFLYWHILVHGVVLILVLNFEVKYWLGIIIILVSHYIIDLIKLNLLKIINSRWLFLWDQIGHFVVIAIVVKMYEGYLMDIFLLNSSKVLLFIIAIILITSVSSVLMKVFISKWDLKEENSSKKSLIDAGAYIGILERLFIFLFIITNNWELIGFLLAAKSVFRFGDLSKSEDRKLTEYILIGTLLSFGLAIVIGLGYNYFIEIIA